VVSDFEALITTWSRPATCSMLISPARVQSDSSPTTDWRFTDGIFPIDLDVMLASSPTATSHIMEFIQIYQRHPSLPCFRNTEVVS
jgi:hypothetical protein